MVHTLELGAQNSAFTRGSGFIYRVTLDKLLYDWGRIIIKVIVALVKSDIRCLKHRHRHGRKINLDASRSNQM